MIPTRKRLLLLAAPLIPVLTSLFGPASTSSQLTWENDPTPSADACEVATRVAGNTAFATRLYRQLRNGVDSNLVLSPNSISLALAMAYAEARGETERQMAQALAFSLDQRTLHTTFGALTSNLVEPGNAEVHEDTYQNARDLRIANTLWGEQGFPFDEASYGADLQKVDFVTAPEAAREEINNWVADQTDDRIQDIVPEGGVTPIPPPRNDVHIDRPLLFAIRDIKTGTVLFLDRVMAPRA